MTADQGFELHPGAASDITGIWEFIAEDNPQAAGCVREDIWTRFAGSFPFHFRVTNGRISLHDRFVFGRCGLLIVYARMKGRFLIIAVLHGRRRPTRYRGHAPAGRAPVPFRELLSNARPKVYFLKASLFTT